MKNHEPSASPARADYVYITSLGHSGSTLLELTLGNHPHIVNMGEVERLSLQFARANRIKRPGLCSCGKRPMDCPVWGAVAEAVRREYGVSLTDDPFGWQISNLGRERDEKWRAPLSVLARQSYILFRLAKYYDLPVLKWFSGLSLVHRRWANNRFFVAKVVKKMTGADTVIDASKEPVGMRDVYDYGSGVVKIIFLTRDVHGVVWSELRRMKGLGDAERFANRWVDVNRRIIRFLEGVPRGDWIHLTYEEFCANPVNVLQRVYGFLGYAYDPAMATGPFGGETAHTIFGNRIRYSKIEAIKEDLSWRQQLTPAQIEQIDRIAGPTAKQLGY
jgi:Sulfotransferase family